jgi:hypothetical protein
MNLQEVFRMTTGCIKFHSPNSHFVKWNFIISQILLGFSTEVNAYFKAIEVIDSLPNYKSKS